MRKVELLPTRDCEVGYGPATGLMWIQRLEMQHVSSNHCNFTIQVYVFSNLSHFAALLKQF